MSFARAKITRFNEKPSPRTDSAAVLKASGSGMKSQIPKISKIPQPERDPVRSRCSLEQNNVQKKPQETPQQANTTPATNEDGGTADRPSAVNDNSVKSEDFKDALDEGKHDGGDIIPERAPLPVTRKESITSRKSSTSGIPLPMKTSTSRVSSTSGSPRARSDSRDSSTKRSLEFQFLAKKKKLEQLKKELEAKQKPVVDLYHTLMQMKKKLEESGKIIPLEHMKFWDLDAATSSLERPAGGGEVVKFETVDVQPGGYMESLRNELEPIPNTFLEMGRCLMGKRTNLLGFVEKMKEELPECHLIDKELDNINEETIYLHKTINEAVERQENRIERILTEIGGLFEKSSLAIANQAIADLEKKLRLQDKTLEDVRKELGRTQQQLKEMKEQTAIKLTDENNFLKERVKVLEGDVQIKKKKLAEQSSTVKTYEQKIDILTKQSCELEKTKKEGEAKISELNGHVRTLQNKLKNAEQKWREEKEEIVKSHKGEHAIFEKLTAERQTLDTRLHLMNNILDEQKKSNEAEQARLRREAMKAKAELSTVMIDKQIAEDKLESLQQEVARLSVQQQQAVDVMKNTINPPDDRGDIITEREAQLQTELLATQVALKAAQERIENYTAEKLRFIDSIEKLNENGENESLAKALVQKEEVITQLEREKKEAAKLVESQSVLISQLNAKIDNLQAGMVVSNLDNIPRDTQELKVMLEEGKAKLQRALSKSLDNEQKLIKYEHDLNQHKKQLNDMDNLLKVRDGLIGMLKTKKDELLMENESLHKYSEEIRQLLFDTKEELKQKTEMIQDLSGNLDTKGRLCYKLEKKIKELEGTLSETNEKRFKLQDTVGTMEKELQSTKAHINQMAEMQTRYEIGMPILNADVNTHRTTNHTNQYGGKNAMVPRQSTFNGEHGDVPKFNRDGNCTGLKGLPQENGDMNKILIATPSAHFPNTYYINMQPYRFHSSYLKKISAAHNPYYRPLTNQSLLTIEPPHKIHTAKNHNSALGLGQLRKNTLVQTQKTSSSAQTTSTSESDTSDKKLRFLVRPNSKYVNRDPYKICCDILSRENTCTIEEIDPPAELSEAKIKERREFIDIVKKLSQFDERREQLGLGREFRPIIFEGISRYKVMDSGSLVWCRPTREMRLNNLLISKDILAHRVPKKLDEKDKIKTVEAIS